jgi:hypothetical protein
MNVHDFIFVIKLEYFFMVSIKVSLSLIYKDMFSKLAYSVFEQSIKDYHQFDNVDQPINNPFPKDKFEHLLYHKKLD